MGVQAWIAAISAFRTELTSRCLASMVLLSNCGETIIAWKACPQPPTANRQHAAYQTDSILAFSIDRSFERRSNATEIVHTRQILNLDMQRLQLLSQLPLQPVRRNTRCCVCHCCVHGRSGSCGQREERLLGGGGAEKISAASSEECGAGVHEVWWEGVGGLVGNKMGGV